MNRRQFLTASLLATFAAVLGKRGAARSDAPKPKTCAGWCVEYISPPAQPDKANHYTAYIPIVNHDH